MKLRNLDPEILKLIANCARMNQLDEESQIRVVVDVQKRLAACKSRSYKDYYPDQNNDILVQDAWVTALSQRSIEHIYQTLFAFTTGQVKHGGFLVGAAEFAQATSVTRGTFELPSDLKNQATLLLGDET